MKEGTPLTRMARIVGLLVALALLLGFLLPLAAAAQETGGASTAVVLSEVPTTGARRPGPVLLASSPVDRPAPRRTEGFAPIELQIDTIGIYAPIETGIIADGVMQNPSGPWVVAWYDQLGQVGEARNVVMAGHVDYYNSGPDGTPGPAVFWDVPKLAPGDVIRVRGENDQLVEYAVEWSRLFEVATELTPEVIQEDVVGDTGQESLTLITCGGPFDPVTGEYLQRWVLRANKL